MWRSRQCLVVPLGEVPMKVHHFITRREFRSHRLKQGSFEGRNWEGFAADPYLTGEAAYASVQGLQDSGVTACAKHFIAYESETFRNVYGSIGSYSVFPANEQLPISANVDDKTLHELYLWPFAEAVRAGVGYI